MAATEITDKALAAEWAARNASEPPPEQPPGPPTERSAPQFPAVHADGSCWTESEHDEAVAAYLRAVESGDPDAGRMRAVIGLHKHPLKGIGERVAI